MSKWHQSLEGTFTMAWSELTRAVADRKSPCRTPVLATLGLDGTPQARMVVLRKATAPLGLEIHTDARANKAAEIANNPQVALVFWHPKRSLQLRVSARARPLAQAEADAAWDRLHPRARAVYGTEPAPGAPLAQPDQGTEGPGRSNFLPLALEITSLETLHLGPDHHARARFTPSGTGQWIAP